MRIGEHSIDRCPVLFLEPEYEHAVWLWQHTDWRGMTPAEACSLPARMVDSLHFLESLKEAAGGN